ncbi:MAG: restriction endonuclease subunit S [Methylobacter sp.]
MSWRNWRVGNDWRSNASATIFVSENTVFRPCGEKMSFVSNLPKGWQATDLGSLFELKYGKSLPAQARDGIGFPVYGSNGVIGNHSEPIVARGGIVIGRKGSYGEVHWSDGSFSPIDTTYFIDEFFDQPARYWFYQLKHLPLSELNRSTAIPGLNREDTYSLEILLPPLAEQQQIATKLDELLGQVDIIKTRLDTIPKVLNRFRQSVLSAAMSGNLTEDWRKEKSFNLEEQYNELLKLKTENQKKIERTSNHEILMDLIPKHWLISNFDNLFRFIDYRGKTPNKSAFGKRLISAKNIKMGFIQNEPVEYISEKDYIFWMRRGFPKNGDIFFVTEGHTMGCAAINDRTDEFALAQRTITLQPYGKLQTKFFLFIMLTGSFQKLVELNATGSAARGIKAAKLRGLPIPFPSIEEQTEIVAQVEQLFAFADQVEQRVKDARKRVNRLTQSILTKAFSGELSADWRAQNPDLISGENSAEALLAKIKAEREALAKSKPTKPRIKKKTGESMKPKNIVPIIEALKAAGQPLSSQDLLTQAGYPGDADTDQLETFFLDIREQLNAKKITRERKGDMEFFAIAE